MPAIGAKSPVQKNDGDAIVCHTLLRLFLQLMQAFCVIESGTLLRVRVLLLSATTRLVVKVLPVIIAVEAIFTKQFVFEGDPAMVTCSFS
jgi:hypothetical protein